MANYNTDLAFGGKQWQGTELNPRTGVVERTATNGSVRMRSLQSVVKYDPVCVHGMLTKTDVDNFKAFYAANRLVPFLYTANEDGIQRTVMFAGATPFKCVPASDLVNWSLTVYMREI